MQPHGRELYVDALLTGALIGYRNPAHIVDEIFPRVGASQQSGIIPQLTQSHWFRNLARKRATGDKSFRSEYGTDLTLLYFADRYSHAAEVYDEDRSRAAGGPFQLDTLASRLAQGIVALKREIDFATNFFAVAKGWTDKAGGTDFTKWSDYAGSNPAPDIEGWKDDQEAVIGAEGRKLVLGKQVAVKLKWHPQLVDTIKHVQRGLVTLDIMREVFDLDRILVGRSIYTTSPEGTAEASVTYTRVWGKHALLLHAPELQSAEMVAPAGCRVVWERVPSADGYIKRMRDEEREADIFEANAYWQLKQIKGKAGTFAENAVV